MHKAPRMYRPFLWHGAMLILIVLFFVLIRNFPLLSTPGFEAANLFVLIFSPLFALVACIAAKREIERNFIGTLYFQILFLCVCIALFSLLLWINSYEQKSCSLGAGWAPFIIILVPPLFLSVTLGALIASLFKRLWLRILALVLIFTAYFSWVAYSWFLDPGFRILTHASLLLTSDLLEGGELSIPIVGFRGATLMIALSLALVGLVFLTHRRFKSTRKPRVLSSVLLIATTVLFAIFLHRGSVKMLGKNHAQLMADYNLTLEEDGIIVRADPNAVAFKDAKKILEEALLFKHRISQLLGTLSQKPLTIWLHKNNADKFLYTGAKNVHFANPKHRELHISGVNIPHNVLGHELAHIYVGEYAQTLFGVPGRLLVFPNLALTEGLAMLLTPELNIESDLTLQEQARALYQSGLGTDIKKLFSTNPLEFISNNVRSSYIFSGAFLEFLINSIPLEDRTRILKKIIHTGTLQDIFANNDQLKKIFASFNERLEAPIDGAAILWAQENFTPKSILSTDCSEHYKHEKKMFQLHLLNDEKIDLILGAIETLPKKDQIELLLAAFNTTLKQGFLEKARNLSQALEKLFLEENDQRINELWLRQASVFLALNDLSKAADNLSRIDEQWLLLPLKRELLIMKEFLLAIETREFDATLYQEAALALGDRSSFKEGSFAQFTHALGKFEKSDARARLLAQYIYARLLIRTHHYQEGLLVLKAIKKYPDRLPSAILDEIEMIIAHTLTELQNYSEAKKAYELLLKKSLLPSKQIVIQDALERISRK